MKISGVIWISGCLVIATMATPQPSAYAESFGLTSGGSFAWATPLPPTGLSETETSPIPPSEIVGYMLSNDGYFLGYGKTLSLKGGGGSGGSGSWSGGSSGSGGSFGSGGSLSGVLGALGNNGQGGGTSGTGNSGLTGNNSIPSFGSNGPLGGTNGNPNGILGSQANLTPQVVTPEPASLLLLGTGIAGLGLLRHRMNRRQNSKTSRQ